MDEEAISADQARRLRQGMTQGGVELRSLWMHYFRLGGMVNLLEVDAYLHQALELPTMQRDLLVQALAEQAYGHQTRPVPFSWNYPITPPGPGDRPLHPAGLSTPPDPADPPEDRPDPTGPQKESSQESPGPAGQSPASERTGQDRDGPPS